METEIEIKLFVSEDAEKALHQLVEQLQIKAVYQQHQLGNTYFDTPDRLLRQWDMGLRIRRSDQHVEQTLKTKGRVIAGLHQRPEYNVPITGSRPELALFDGDIWPADCDLEQLQAQLNGFFTTDFTRHSWMLIYPEGSVVEMVFDVGTITADKGQQKICEVEFELIKGQPELLFKLAEQLAELCPVRFGNISKAARGYQLVNGDRSVTRLLTLAPVSSADSLEEGYTKVLQHAMDHWQHHQEVFMASQDWAALVQMRHGAELILHLNQVFSEVIPPQLVAEMQGELTWLVEQLQSIDQVIRLESLIDHRGQKIKKIEGHRKLLQALQQQHSELPTVDDMQALINSARHSQLISSLIQWQFFSRWQSQSDPQVEARMQERLKSLADHHQNKSWSTIQQSMPKAQAMTYQDYLDQKNNLQRSLYTGICFGNIYDGELRGTFRAPWLDISHGIMELLQFEPLRNIVKKSTNDSAGQLKDWIERKEASLVHAMEQSRQLALKMRPYWP